MSIVGAPRRAGPYHINIQGLPAAYTWQDLKDLVREHASHGIYTDLNTVRFADGQSTLGGTVRVLHLAEAIKVYTYLSRNLVEGHALRVELWDVTDPVESKFLKRNYRQTAQQAAWARDTIAQAHQSAGQSHAQPGPPWNIMYAVQPVAAPLARPVYYQAHEYAAPVPTPYPTMPPPAPHPQPSYATRDDGIQINVSHGAALTEARGVFVSELDFNLREEDVKALFSGYGQIVKCKLARNHHGQSKGTATVLYSSVAEAKTAVQTLNGFRFGSRVLQVRHDKEEIPVAPPARDTSSRSRAGARNEPLVANGSGIRRRF